MGGILEAIENSGIATWIRESPSLFAYTFVLSLHAIGLAIVVGLSAMVSLRLLGFASGVPVAPLARFYPLMWFGFTINAISGLLLLSANASNMLSMLMFYLKMAFIVAAVAMLELIRQRVFANASALAGGPLPGETRKLAWALLVFWVGAIITGRLTAYPYFVEAWFGL